MIEIYTGVPGSGKSAHAARDIRHNLCRRDPRPVIANFELAESAPVKNRKRFLYVPNAEMSVDLLKEHACDWWEKRGYMREEGIDLYLDEAQLLWNSRNWSQKGRLEWLEFLSQSRKFGYHIVFIAQSAQMIDNQFRMLIEIEVNHRRLQNMGLAGWLMALPFGGRLVCGVRSMFQIKQRIGATYLVLSSKDWAMYDSYKRFDRQDAERLKLVRPA